MCMMDSTKVDNELHQSIYIIYFFSHKQIKDNQVFI